MQDRYAGDIGDYGKIALLRAIQSEGLSVGVNWYRVVPRDYEKNANGSFKQNDGGHLITEAYKECDELLAEQLVEIANSEIGRSIENLEGAKLISGALYYSDPVPVAKRKEWHERALERLEGANIIFMDPDNGLIVKSVGEKSARSIKYVLYDEVKECIKNNHSVLIYNHRSRKPEERYFYELYTKLKEITEGMETQLLKITFPRYSVRDYIAVCRMEHYDKVRAAFLSMTQGVWGQKKMCFINLMGDDIKDVFEFQEMCPSQEARELALKHMTDEQIRKLISTCGTTQGKAYYKSFLRGQGR